MAGRRRLDQILEPGYLDGLEDRPTDAIRRMRDACQEEESALSYARRLVQGKLDIVRAEALRRRDAGDEQAGDVLSRLAEVLSREHQRTDPAHTRATRFLVPPGIEHSKRVTDRVVEEQLSDLGARSTGDLEHLADRLGEMEHGLSAARQQLFERIGALEAELGNRYKSGEARVGEVIARRL